MTYRRVQYRQRQWVEQEKWIAPARKEYRKHVSLSTSLRVPKEENLPRTFLKRIVDTPIGQVARNPTQRGRKMVRVTKTIKKAANFVYNIGK
jgi:hypothetical protein